MATITTSDLEVVLPKAMKKKIEVEELKGGTEITALKNVSNLETKVRGTATFDGKGVSKSPIDLKSTKKETPKLVFKNTNYTKSDITISGKGKGIVKTESGTFNNSKVKGGKKNDSISFGKKATVNKGKFNLDKGNDSITFNKATKFKGKTTIDLGKGGKDVITFGKEVKGGSVVISNFDKKDKLVVGKDTFKYNDIKKGAEIPGIDIKLA